MKTYVIKDLRPIVRSSRIGRVSAGTKKFFAHMYIDSSKYRLIDILGRGSKVLLEARYYNTRDKRGRFAKTRNR